MQTPLEAYGVELLLGRCGFRVYEQVRGEELFAGYSGVKMQPPAGRSYVLAVRK